MNMDPYVDEIHKWMEMDGFEAPKVGCKWHVWHEAFPLLNNYIKHLRSKQRELHNLKSSPASGYLLKKGELLIGGRERCLFKTKKGAEKLQLNYRGHVVRAIIMEEFSNGQ